MCNKRSNNNKKLNDYLSVDIRRIYCCAKCITTITGEIEESVACEERSQQEETLYVSCRRLSIEWLTASLRLMGDSSVYSRFFNVHVSDYYYIAVAELCAFVHAWEVILAVYNFIKSWRTGVREKNFLHEHWNDFFM